MLGNFSFGDYFKLDAIRYAWELMTGEYGLDPERFYATVHHSDDEAAAIWADEIGLPPERIYRLGDKDNFWQMADTGPCGPCSELHYDLRAERTPVTGTEEFVELNESGRIVELWNLVFMQFDRDAEGTLHPLPAPCVDTGAGLERIAAVLQGADSNYHTDLFAPLLARVAELVGRPYEREGEEGVSYRVLADHARAVAFLLCDGVFPSNEGRGYVLRRILRRAVRHAWLMGRREPTLVGVVDAVVDQMGDVYPDLRSRRDHLLDVTRAEEQRFLATIEGGLTRFDEWAAGGGGTFPGSEAF
jgi:alanyl-tRNA synthetase